MTEHERPSARVEDAPGGAPGAPQPEPPEQPKTETPPEPPRPSRTKRLQLLQGKLHGLYMSPMQVVMPLAQLRGDERLHAACVQYVTLVPATVESWIDLAETNPAVLDALENVVNGSTIGTLIVNHLMMIYPFLPEHLTQRIMPFSIRVQEPPPPGTNGHPLGGS